MPVKNVELKLNLRTAQAKEQVRQTVNTVVREQFEIEIKTAAKEGSPVLTGTNRRSIDTEVTEVPGGIQAELFTQSGYGGFLEIGTKKMPARPYLQPAFDQGVAKIGDKIGELLK